MYEKKVKSAVFLIKTVQCVCGLETDGNKKQEFQYKAVESKGENNMLAQQYRCFLQTMEQA